MYKFNQFGGSRITYSDGVYEGETNATKLRHGNGVMVWIKDDKVIKEFKGIWENDNLKNGIMKYVNNSEYNGMWKDNKKHGQGVMIWKQGNIIVTEYNGMWENDMKHGPGKHTYHIDNNHKEYNGMWEKNKLYEGTITLKSGTRIIGEWKDNVGINVTVHVTHTGIRYHSMLNQTDKQILSCTWNSIELKNGNKYEGLCTSDITDAIIPNIWGIYTYTKPETLFNEIQYEGEILEGKKSGPGLMKYKNNIIYDGMWKNDVIVGYGTFIMQDKTRYNGRYNNIKYTNAEYWGQTIKSWEMNNIYTDESLIKHGYGILKLANNDKIIVGKWENNKFMDSNKFLSDYGFIWEQDLGFGSEGSVSVYNNNGKKVFIKKINIFNRETEFRELSIAKLLLMRNYMSKFIHSMLDTTSYYYVYEYDEKYDSLHNIISKKIKKGSFTDRDKIIIITKLFELVSNIHKKAGVAHLDIKLQNIISDENYNLKFIDFNHSCIITNSCKTSYSPTYIFWPFFVPGCNDNIRSTEPIDKILIDYFSLGMCIYMILSNDINIEETQNLMSKYMTIITFLEAYVNEKSSFNFDFRFRDLISGNIQTRIQAIYIYNKTKSDYDLYTINLSTTNTRTFVLDDKLISIKHSNARRGSIFLNIEEAQEYFRLNRDVILEYPLIFKNNYNDRFLILDTSTVKYQDYINNMELISYYLDMTITDKEKIKNKLYERRLTQYHLLDCKLGSAFNNKNDAIDFLRKNPNIKLDYALVFFDSKTNTIYKINKDMSTTDIYINNMNIDLFTDMFKDMDEKDKQTIKKIIEPKILVLSLPESSSNKFSILSFNMQFQQCKMFPDFFTKGFHNNADIICTQEDNDNVKKYDYMNYMKGVICGNTTTGSGSGLYYKSELSKNISNVKCIQTEGYSPQIGNRDAIIFEYKTIKIANLHLEGGRFADNTIKNLSEFNRMLEYKEQLLTHVIAEQPDIILGDFNSVYSSNMDQLTQFLEGQHKYFSMFVLKRALTSDEIILINKMNVSVYEKLKAAGYIYCVPTNEHTTVTNGQGNSIIDTIWYKENKIKKVSCSIINMMHPTDDYQKNICISDHNPVYAEFMITIGVSMCKYIKYTNIPSVDTDKSKYMLYKHFSEGKNVSSLDTYESKYLKYGNAESIPLEEIFFYKKYLLYKKKYLKLKNYLGGMFRNQTGLVPTHSFGSLPVVDTRKLFDLYPVTTDKILYHSSLFKITTDLIPPTFFSEDITQSLGHILTIFTHIFEANTYETVIKFINKYYKHACYPFIHKYRPQRNLVFLKLNFPHIYKDSHGLLYNIPILTKYILNLTKEFRIKLLKTHIDKMNNIKKNTSNLSVYESDDIESIERNIIAILTQYTEKCTENCFMGWVDTPGLHLLSGINYNEYFKEIKLIKMDENIDGIYVAEDQDELILFNSSAVVREDSLYILPYSFFYKSIEEKKQFIMKHMEYLRIFNNNNSDTRLYNLIKEFNLFDSKTWNFTWYRTQCANFNPLENIVENCSKDNICGRYASSMKEHLFEYNNWTKNMCGRGTSFKLQIEFMSEYNIIKLKEYIEFIKSNNDKDNINLWDKICLYSIDETNTHRKA